LGRNLCRDLWEWGLRPGDHAIQGSGPRGPFLHCVQMLGAVPLVLPHIQADWREVFELMAQYRPVWVHTGYPTLSKWEELSREYDLKEVFASFKFFTFGGDHLGRLWRERVEGWVPAIHEWTSAGDCGFATQCREHDGFHVWEDNVLAEGLDPNGTRPLPDGELVELTTTGLDQRAGPLLRFRSEDLVRITRDACACGRTHARFRLLGRKGDQLAVQGQPIFTRDFYDIIEAIPETRAGIFQLIREAKEMDVLRLRVGYQPALTGDVADLGERIRAAIEDQLGLIPDLDLVPEEQILANSMSYKVTRVVKQ
jgi:phenylacetate-CoA ligase